MSTSNTLGELLSTLLERRPFSKKSDDPRSIEQQCLALLSERTEVSGLQLAASILNCYRLLDETQKAQFFEFLDKDLDVDAALIAEKAGIYAKERSAENYKALSSVSEPVRQELLRRLNQAPGATAELVDMRRDLLGMLKESPELTRIDFDFRHLLKSWFNRGFLVLRQITWDSPASILEKIIAYEAVHEISNWDDLRRRLQPADRRCYAFFHPAMPDDPLIFVEVALTKGVPGSIQQVLLDTRQPMSGEDADTAVFYSISNCQAGLAGISFGNSLIKQVVSDLSRDLNNLKTFVTLSPIPGLGRWLKDQPVENDELSDSLVRKYAAYYLLEAKAPNGGPLDPVARFHLGNGALIHQVHANADISDKGMSQSKGAMVNYLYDLSRIPRNIERLGRVQEIAAASQVKSLAKQAGKDVGLAQAKVEKG